MSSWSPKRRCGGTIKGCIGQPHPGIAASLVNEDSSDVSEGSVGELLIRTPARICGSIGDPDAMARLPRWLAPDWRSGPPGRRRLFFPQRLPRRADQCQQLQGRARGGQGGDGNAPLSFGNSAAIAGNCWRRTKCRTRGSSAPISLSPRSARCCVINYSGKEGRGQFGLRGGAPEDAGEAFVTRPHERAGYPKDGV